MDKDGSALWWWSGLLVTLAICLRPFRLRGRRLVVLYGPRFNGNIKAFADYLEQSGANKGCYMIAYATSDLQYYRQILQECSGVEILSTKKLKDMVKIGQASAVITTHDMGSLTLLHKLTNVKCVNVWHGIGWKGHVPEDFLFLKKFTDNWVTSPSFKYIYEHDFGIKSPIHVTGYARTDNAVCGSFSVADIRKRYKINPKFKKIILVAPTWEQNNGKHHLYPFGSNAEQFLVALNNAASKCDGLAIFRTHINSGDITLPRGLKNIVFMPSNAYPVTEDFLYIADVLISDWSSIVFDYLVLKRPILFLDVPVPYELLCFTTDYRFGEIVSTLDETAKVVERYLRQPQLYIKKHDKAINRALQLGYNTTLDGKSAERYHQRLLELLEIERSY